MSCATHFFGGVEHSVLTFSGLVGFDCLTRAGDASDVSVTGFPSPAAAVRFPKPFFVDSQLHGDQLDHS